MAGGVQAVQGEGDEGKILDAVRPLGPKSGSISESQCGVCFLFQLVFDDGNIKVVHPTPDGK